jgi:tetratricopeptide (TPR) repeat protein
MTTSASKNMKNVKAWEDLKKQLTKAEKHRDWELVIELSRAAIALDAKDRTLNIKPFLFYSDIGECYFKMKEYKQALENFEKAKELAVKFRATEKLKYPEDWLAEIRTIDKFIGKINDLWAEWQ